MMAAIPPIRQLPLSSSEQNLRVEVFSVCEEAWVRSGRLDLLGIIDRITVPQLPCLYRSLKVAVRLRFPRDEFGVHYYALHSVDPQGGAVVAPQSAPFYINSSDAVESAVFDLIVPLPELALALPGEYHLALYLNGREEARLPIRVREWELRFSAARAPELRDQADSRRMRADNSPCHSI